MIPSKVTVLGLDLYLYGLIIGIAVIPIVLIIEKKFGEKLKVEDYILGAFLVIFSARFIHVLHSINYYFTNPVEIIDLSDGGFAIHGAILGGALAVLTISKLRDIKFFKFTDPILTLLPLTQAVGRWGNFVNQELYGKPTELPWGIFISKENRLSDYENFTHFHPTFFYESVLNLANFGLLIYLSKKHKLKTGIISGLYLINYGIIRLLVNRIRVDREYFLGIETSDIYSIITLLIGLCFTYYLLSYRNPGSGLSVSEQ